MTLTRLPVDSRSLELGRLARLRQALAATDHAGAIFFDPTAAPWLLAAFPLALSARVVASRSASPAPELSGGDL
jgi:hypothetical protein